MTSQSALSREEISDIIFQPLNTRDHEVRHVRLHPAVALDDPIVCTLEIISLSKNVFFTALSWCWGSPNLSGSIIINGYPWAVPASLEIALRYLRYVEKTRTLWIDALCINQSNMDGAIAERNHQIQLMKLIFSMAPQTVIWLGVPSASLASFVQKTIVEGSIEPTSDLNADDIALALIELLRLPWWSRLWVVQEAVLGSKVEMQLGRARFIFRFLIQDIQSFMESHEGRIELSISETLRLEMGRKLRIFDLLEHQHVRASDIRQSIYEATDKSSTNNTSDIEKNGLANFPTHLDLILDNKGIDAPYTLFRLLSTCRLRRASDPHDKLYGLLGLMSPEVAAALQPDYAEPVQTTYIRLARCFIRQDGFRFLSQALPSLRNPSLGLFPSWLPDWSETASASTCEATPFRCVQPIYTAASIEMVLWCRQIRRFHGTYVRDTLGNGYGPCPTLVTPGIKIDTASNITDVLPGISSFDLWRTKVEPLLSSLCSQIWPNPNKKGVETVSVTDLAPTCLTGKNFPSFSDRHRRRSAIMKVFSKPKQQFSLSSEPLAKEFPKAAVESWLEDASLDALFHGCYDVDKSMSFFSEWGTYLSRTNMGGLLEATTTNRRLFFTPDNHIGNGPYTMQEGDAIFHLPGAFLPCVLRPVPDRANTYTFVGECYLELYGDSGRLAPERYSQLESQTSAHFKVPWNTSNVEEMKEKLSIRKYSRLQAFTSINII